MTNDRIIYRRLDKIQENVQRLRSLEGKSFDEFISDSIHWPICERCSDIHWRAATEDKWLSYTILQQADIAVIWLEGGG